MSKNSIVPENKGIARPLDINVIHWQRARFLNEEISDLYDILLVTCPNCGSIISFNKNPPLDEICECVHCWVDNPVHLYPDFFY